MTATVTALPTGQARLDDVDAVLRLGEVLSDNGRGDTGELRRAVHLIAQAAAGGHPAADWVCLVADELWSQCDAETGEARGVVYAHLDVHEAANVTDFDREADRWARHHAADARWHADRLVIAATGAAG